jgi:hypothetical protein
VVPSRSSRTVPNAEARRFTGWSLGVLLRESFLTIWRTISGDEPTRNPI